MIGIGDPVSLASERTSMKGGAPTVMSANLKGRVCRMTAAGTCWVQFGGSIGCRRLDVSSLVPASEPAPLCTAACQSGQA